MSVVFDAAAVSLQMADYAVTDRIGKLQMIGGGMQVVARDHAKGTSSAFALVITVTLAPSVINEQYAFETVLENVDGTPVDLAAPVPDAVDGHSKVMRFGQTLQVEEPNFRGAGVPRHALPPRTQMVLYFNTGLPLPAGRTLVWRARIDGESKPDWTLPFYVPGEPAGPVLG
jgi:hypothetical protein